MNTHNQSSDDLGNLKDTFAESPIRIENCYVVYPDRDRLDFEMILADPGEAGQQAITEHYDRLKWAMDLDQLAATVEMAKKLDILTTGPYWFKKPRHFLFIAIKDGGPVAKFVVQAVDISKAVAKAAKAWPGCQFNIVGLLEQFESAGDAFLSILNGGLDTTTLDLRTP